MAEARIPVIAVATKADSVGNARLTEHLIQIDQLGEWADIIPVSAVSGYPAARAGASAPLAHADLSRRCTRTEELR